ncbi:uncharacterized protein CC84DRAFT_194581 [Paraphaeosphaeria sporulosa]|uniref:Uncharacterized protein n=1 Tax=Paraphaeosphaeria sporulosa TaxID=1460663 RepID=A0A177C3H5_9PLEO|nr:uncharacterized protein CC84DRAFT_194581 [Paraphaeosphaeria sporulosa]OAG01432.1 hypothetical protein CC84DRAFT_194581 [Paraphaeosphaeria sporulosa]
MRSLPLSAALVYTSPSCPISPSITTLKGDIAAWTQPRQLAVSAVIFVRSMHFSISKAGNDRHSEARRQKLRHPAGTGGASSTKAHDYDRINKR